MTDDDKRGISRKFHAAIKQLERREITLSTFTDIANATAVEFPCGEQQQNFYAAMIDLAGKVAKTVGAQP